MILYDGRFCPTLHWPVILGPWDEHLVHGHYGESLQQLLPQLRVSCSHLLWENILSNFVLLLKIQETYFILKILGWVWIQKTKLGLELEGIHSKSYDMCQDTMSSVLSHQRIRWIYGLKKKAMILYDSRSCPALACRIVPFGWTPSIWPLWGHDCSSYNPYLEFPSIQLLWENIFPNLVLLLESKIRRITCCLKNAP